MNSKFISNLFLIIFLNILVKPFYVFGIDMSVQNRLGSEEYGMYFSLYSMALIFNIVLDMGINNYNTKNIAQNPIVLQKYLGKIFGVRIALFFLYTLLVFTFALVLDYEWQQYKILFWLVISQFFSAGIMFLRSNFGGLHLFRLDSLISIIDRVILIALGSILLWSGLFDYQFDIIYFVYAQTIAYFSSFLIAVTILFVKTDNIKIKLDKKVSVTILKRSFPYALLIILMMIYSRVDTVMIERISGAQEAGFYAQSFRILDAFNMVGYLFVGLLLPIISRLIQKKGDYMEIVDLAFRILIPFSLVAIGLTFFFSSEIMNMAYTHVGANVPSTFFLLMISFLGICLTFVYGTLLTANGSLKILNIAAVVGLGVNIILNSILIPKMGAEGAAVATVFTQLFVALVQIVIVHSLFESQRLNKTYLVIIAFGGLISGAFYLTNKIEISWIAIIFLNIAISLILYFTFGILKLKKLKQILFNNGE